MYEFDRYPTFDKWLKENYPNEPNDRESDHEMADFVKDENEYASKDLIKLANEIKELTLKQQELRKEFLSLSRKSDINKREKLNKELIRIYILITSKDHEFQRLLSLEEPGYNENI